MDIHSCDRYRYNTLQVNPSSKEANSRRTKMYLDRSFCMEVGQIKSGANVEDTYHKMLQQVHRVTPQIADTITGTYKSVYALISAFKRDGPSVLEGLQVDPLR